MATYRVNESPRRQISEPVLLALAGGLVCLQVFLCTQIRLMDSAFVDLPRTQDEKINPTLFKALTFGHYPAAVDSLLLKFLSDPAYIHIVPGVHPPAYFDLDLATDLDPWFFELYTMGANFLAVVRDDGPGAKNLLLKARQVRDHELPSEEFQNKFWHRGWYVSALLGYVNLFELHDLPSAAVAFSEGALLPGAPQVLQSLNSQMTTPAGQYKVGIRLLDVMIAGEKNPESKDKLIAQRNSLFVGEFLYGLNQLHQNHPLERLPLRDPWGGRLSLKSDGKIDTSTEHQKVMGLE